jgi:hypothetical protein
MLLKIEMHICYVTVVLFDDFTTDSEDLMNVQYIVKSDQLTVTKHTEKSISNGDGPHLSRNKFCLVFSGHKLQVTQIKDWLRSCGKQVGVVSVESIWLVISNCISIVDDVVHKLLHCTCYSLFLIVETRDEETHVILCF